MAWAQKAAELTDFKDPLVVDTLAVAFAADGNFEAALVAAKAASDYARKSGNPQIAALIEARIPYFERQEPWPKTSRE